MSARQASFSFVSGRADLTPTWADAGGTAFEIGWDHAQRRLTPPVEHLQASNPVRHGWEAGLAVFGTRTRQATPQVRKWLQLRIGAWQRGRTFETLTVTPAFLRRIEVDHCPITHEPLTHATGTPSDASVDRVNNDAGYAAGNLAVMSARANRAKAHYAWDDAMAFVRQIEAGNLGEIDGLGAGKWARLAVLMSFTTPLAHSVAAALPMLLLPPPRLRLLNPVQCLQTLLTLQFTRDGYTRRIAALTGLMPGSQAQDHLRMFMHTLLARRIAAGFGSDGAALRRTLEDLWRDPLVLRRWQRLALSLTEAQCEHIVREAHRRGLAGQQFRWLPRALATESWALETRGYLEAKRPDAPRGAASIASQQPTQGVPIPIELAA